MGPPHLHRRGELAPLDRANLPHEERNVGDLPQGLPGEGNYLRSILFRAVSDLRDPEAIRAVIGEAVRKQTQMLPRGTESGGKGGDGHGKADG